MWNTAIDYLNYAIVSVLAHLILLAVIRPRWILLMNSFQHFINLFDLSFYVELRRISFIGIASIILHVSTIKSLNFGYDLTETLFQIPFYRIACE